MYPNDQLSEALDENIKKGIGRGKRIRRTRSIRKWSSVISILTITIFLSAVRISPVFASYVSNIPGMEYLVDLISFDKGLQAAVDNEFIQHINVSDEKELIILTIKDIIVDNTSMVIFYSIENNSVHSQPGIHDMHLKDEAGKNLPISSGVSYTPYEGSVYNGNMSFYFPDEANADFEIPNTVILSAHMKVAVVNSKSSEYNESFPTLDSTWEVAIPIDKTKFENTERHYVINQSVEISGQRIVFEKASIYPTRIALDVSYDTENTMNILGIEGLVLVDETGDEWGGIMNGISASHISSNNIRLYFQSNYFTTPKELYIKGSAIRALNKDQMELLIDIDTEKILKAPDEKIQIEDITLDDNTMSLTIHLEKDPKYIQHALELLKGTGKDLNSTELHQERISGSTSDNWDFNEYRYSFSFDKPLVGPIRFQISDYPNRIEQEFKVQILP